MNERHTIWKNLREKAEARLATVDTDYPSAEPAVLERIRNGERDSVQMCREFEEFHS